MLLQALVNRPNFAAAGLSCRYWKVRVEIQNRRLYSVLFHSRLDDNHWRYRSEHIWLYNNIFTGLCCCVGISAGLFHGTEFLSSAIAFEIVASILLLISANKLKLKHKFFMTEEIGYPKFMKDTAVNKLKDNIYCGNLSDSWSIGGA